MLILGVHKVKAYQNLANSNAFTKPKLEVGSLTPTYKFLLFLKGLYQTLKSNTQRYGPTSLTKHFKNNGVLEQYQLRNIKNKVSFKTYSAQFRDKYTKNEDFPYPKKLHFHI